MRYSYILFLIGLLLIGCSREDAPPAPAGEGILTETAGPADEAYFFVLDETWELLTDADKQTLDACVEQIKTFESLKDRDDPQSREQADAALTQALEPLKALYAQVSADDSAAGRRRSAAIAWVLIDFTWNHFTGTCAVWLMRAADLGLIEAAQICRDPPTEALATYLLSPDEQLRWRAAHRTE